MERTEAAWEGSLARVKVLEVMFEAWLGCKAKAQMAQVGRDPWEPVDSRRWNRTLGSGRSELAAIIWSADWLDWSFHSWLQDGVVGERAGARATRRLCLVSRLIDDNGLADLS